LTAQYAVYASNGTAKPIRFSIDADGKPSPVVIEHRKSGREVTVAAATNGRNLLTVWNDQPGEWNTVGIFGRVDAGPARALSLSANEQKSAAIAHGGGLDLVVWRDESGVYAARLDVAGRSLDGAGVLLGASPYSGAPAVAFDGTEFVVAWNEEPYGPYAEIHGAVRFVSPAEGLLPGALSIDGLRSGPALIRGGDGTFIAWTDASIVSTVYAARISSATRAFEGSPMRT
ncbi:MAG TPA: hypothetical protein VIW45_17215, partial [Vicinamibacterales bacterium]